MIFKYCAFALLALCAMASKAQAQECGKCFVFL